MAYWAIEYFLFIDAVHEIGVKRPALYLYPQARQNPGPLPWEPLEFDFGTSPYRNKTFNFFTLFCCTLYLFCTSILFCLEMSSKWLIALLDAVHQYISAETRDIIQQILFNSFPSYFIFNIKYKKTTYRILKIEMTCSIKSTRKTCIITSNHLRISIRFFWCWCTLWSLKIIVV